MLGKLIPSITSRAFMLLLTVPEAVVMLFIAVLLDFCGLILFIFSLFGVGIPLSFMSDIAGGVAFGLWGMTRPLTKNVMGNVGAKVGEQVSQQLSNAGIGQQDGPAGEIIGAASNMGGKAGSIGIKGAKAGAKMGLSLIRFVITAIIELIPFVGDLMPCWTIFVISEFIEGEILS